ncbi:5-(carboxyamino)imidazole ribonucleotide synthase [Nostocoides sp.]|uniref:5-(carboxyamino)imidazole ribonucleotide synthase n=2 Tax=Nostocoides sp. TaxID=1917966 RepID=UPI002CB4C241|nr:5-(carboxyamino)imidazole ribonucleotide synthase [Tetrasphaera sp.]
MDASASAPARAPGGFPVVGIIGGGQLARMCAGPATELGITLSVLSETADGAAALAVRSAPVGDYTDPETVLAFARGCDVITFDHEHVPAPVLAALAAAGVIMRPAPAALIYAQDKLAMRSRLHDLGIPCPRWTRADTLADVAAFGAEVGWPVVAKVPVGGYDGKGVRVLTTPGEATAWLRRGPVLLEERVDFVRELAVLVARSPSGQAAAWPVVETVQSEGVCSEVHAPAPDLDPQLAAAATAAGLRIAGELGVTGVLAVEIFETRAGFVVNELAMRPHNSGHWSMDGAVTGQFEQHLRAVLDLPLGDPRPRGGVSVMANVLGGDYPQLYPAYRHLMARDPGLKVHMYGKGVRPGRKIGHVTVVSATYADAQERARHAADYLRGVVSQ